MTNKSKSGKYFAWDESFDRRLLLREVGRGWKNENGRVSVQGTDHIFWTPALISALNSSKEVGYLKDHCIRKAIFDPGVSFVDPDKFIETCERIFEQISNGPKKNFVIACSLTYEGPKLFDSISSSISKIKWQLKGSKFERRVFEARKKLVPLLRENKINEDEKGLTYLYVQVEAVDPHHAVILATNEVDRLRGVLNLLINSTRGISPFPQFTKIHALNRFRAGPYRSAHNIDGSLATEIIWYEPRWQHDQNSIRFTADINKTKKTILDWWRRAETSPLKENVTEGLLRYCRALDQHDQDASLIALWGALESLTGTQREKYEITVSRVTRLFKDDSLARQIALHIKNRRNANIHAAKSLTYNEIDAVIWQAEILVSKLIFFYLKDGRRFKSQRELLEFLDLPLSQVELRRQIKMLKSFQKYRSR